LAEIALAEIALGASKHPLNSLAVSRWEIAEPIWREESSGSAEEWLEAASATLIGFATLAGALFGVYKVLRRD
jgi:hypothetical protein